MTKNKILSIILMTSVLLSICFSFVIGVNAESPNLLQMYGYNPNFDKSNNVWQTLENAKIERFQDSSDGDGWCLKVSQRDSDYSVPSLMGNNALQIFLQQGSGTYYYSFYVKCAEAGQKMRIRPQMQLIYGGTYSAAGMADGSIVGKWPYGENKEGFYVDSTAWTKVEMTVTFNKNVRNKEGITKIIGEAKLYGSQVDFDGVDGVGGSNAFDLLFDNYTLIKKTGNWTYINSTPVPTATADLATITPGSIATLNPINPTITAAPQKTQTPSPAKTAEPTDKPVEQEIIEWSFAEIALDMFGWNKSTDAETGITHYFDNKTRVINWVLILLALVALAAIIYAVLPVKLFKKQKGNIEEQEIIEQKEE